MVKYYCDRCGVTVEPDGIYEVQLRAGDGTGVEGKELCRICWLRLKEWLSDGGINITKSY